jgi:hypothetical protein
MNDLRPRWIGKLHACVCGVVQNAEKNDADDLVQPGEATLATPRRLYLVTSPRVLTWGLLFSHLLFSFINP